MYNAVPVPSKLSQVNCKQKCFYPHKIHQVCSFGQQYRKGPDRLVHQMLTVPATINPEKSLLWDPDLVDFRIHTCNMPEIKFIIEGIAYAEEHK